MRITHALIICFGLLPNVVSAAEIEPTWQSMAENYEVPAWFQDGKIGVWMHWGISSAIDENRPHDGSHYGRRMYGVEGYDGRSEPDIRTTANLTKWHTERYGHPSEFGYEKLIPMFKAEEWDPDGLVRFFKECGSRFIMPVATHHDNFDMYESSFPWNSVDMGPKCDTIQEWKDAARKHGLKFGVSTHLYWSPRFFKTARQYQKPGTSEWLLFNMDYDPGEFAAQDSWNEHWYARCWELIERYDPDMFNNDSPYPDERRGKSLGVKLFSSFLNRDRKENGGQQTTVLSFKNPNVNRAAFTYNLERGMFGEMQEHPWIWATDLSGNWFYRKAARTRMSLPVLIGNAVDAISKNGVVMMNVAQRGDGTLPAPQAVMLRAFGAWINVNGEGIYGTRPWKVFGEGPLVIETRRSGENLKAFSAADIRFTVKDGDLYAFVMTPPTEDIVIKTLRTGGLYEDEIGQITMLGSSEILHWKRLPDRLIIQLPKMLPDQPVIGFRIKGKIGLVSAAIRKETSAGFIHPGISHNEAELEFVKSKLKTREQPWKLAWEELSSSSYAALSLKPRPVAHVERGAYNRPDIGGTFFMRDATAAYTHALLWVFTGNGAHAHKAADILDAWSSTLESVSNHDARLLVGMGGIQFCNAAELLKESWDSWPQENQEAFGTMLRSVLYPVIQDFYPTANGNWDAA
ncbi:MAG: alpha-L-fucosidase, partial [Desulfobacterales bacterium]|nr:alpha-L-fucosidase [Desulfobacterales bacterium]